MITKDTPVREDGFALDLRSFFWSILSGWRKILSCLLIGMLCLGGGKGITGFLQLRSADYLRSAKAQNEARLLAYREETALLDEQIERLGAQLDSLKQFGGESALMGIDPLNVFVRERSYRLVPDAAVEAAPARGALLSALTQAYGSALKPLANDPRLTSFALPQPVPSTLTTVNPLPDLWFGSSSFSLLTVSTDEAGGILSLRAAGGTEEDALALLQAAEELLASAEPALAKALSAHSLSPLQDSSYTSVSGELMSFRFTYDALIHTLRERIEALTAERLTIASPALIEVSAASVVKSGVKYALLGAVAGAALAVIGLVFAFFAGDRIAAVPDLSYRYPLPVLGVYSPERKARKLDRLIARRRGLRPDDDAQAALALIAANLQAFSGESGDLLLCGSADRAHIEALGAGLARTLTDRKLRVGGSVCSDAESVRALGDCGGIVLVEELGKTGYAEIDREIARIRAGGGKLLGFLLVG